MWIRVQLDPVSLPHLSHIISDNTFFLHIATDYGVTPKARSTAAVIGKMKEGAYILVKGARVDKIKRGVKRDDGGYDEVEEIGVRATPNKITVSSERLPSLNLGMVEGKILRQGSNTIIVEEPYMVPGENREWKSRHIPIILPKEPEGNVTGKYIVAMAKLSGRNQSGDQKVCGYATEEMVIA
jgi:hypothetical protein